MLTAVTRTVAARASLARPFARSIHIENTVGNNTPFSYKNGGAFGVKLVAFCATGFSIPFVAAGYQLHKAAA